MEHVDLSDCGGLTVDRKIILAVAIAVLLSSMAMACGRDSSKLSESDCEKADPQQTSKGFLARTDAEELAVASLSESSPATSAVDIERIEASCLTTLGWFEQHLLQGISRSNPDLYPPDMPIWVIQVKGMSRSERSGENFNNSYAVATVDAISGEVMGQLYRFEPLLTP